MVVVIIQRIMATTFLEERPVVRWYLQKVLETVWERLKTIRNYWKLFKNKIKKHKLLNIILQTKKTIKKLFKIIENIKKY